MDWKKRSIKRVARVTGDMSVTPTESTVSNWCSEKVYWALPVSGQLRALLVVVVIQGIAISNTMCESSCVKERFLSHKMKYSIFPMVSKISIHFFYWKSMLYCVGILRRFLSWLSWQFSTNFNNIIFYSIPEITVPGSMLSSVWRAGKSESYFHHLA